MTLLLSALLLAAAPPTHDALAEVNAARAKRGLPAFRRDEALTKGAKAAAAYRAEHRIAGHYRDFSFLPEGATAKAAGCGALPPSWGFQACCVYERWTYAGAATAKGKDGRLYHHIFVR